jgi:glycosyltransferase involved in cell wall biosynthesis
MGSKKNINMKLMKVIYARTQFWFNLIAGGSVGHTLGVLNGFKENGCNIKIISNERILGIDDFNYTIIKPKTKKTLGEFLYNFYAKDRVKKEILKFKPDFIYHRYTGYTFFVAKIANELNIPLVLEFNSFDTWKMKHWGGKSRSFVKEFIKKYLLYSIVKWIENYNLKKAFLITTVSLPLKEDLFKLGIPEEKILVNPNGVDLKKFNPVIENSIESKELRQKLGINNNELVVGFSGTFGPWHGIPQLTEAIDIILSEKLTNHIHFLLIGDGILRCEMIKKLKKYRNVTFTGTISYSEIQNYLALCDILVSPHCPQVDGKEFFGSPTKLFEYMSMGKGIVASKLGQIGEILKDDQTAILVKPGDVGDLVKGIRLLSSNSELRKRLGENAREEIIKKYTWDKHVEKILKKIGDIIILKKKV